MFIIGKEFTFSSAHQLFDLPKGHKCGVLHGHNYTIELILVSDILDETGFVVDYGNLSFIKDWIDNKLDHKNLNDVFDFQTSAEKIAQALFFTFKLMINQKYPKILLQEVVVSETPKTFASYRGN